MKHPPNIIFLLVILFLLIETFSSLIFLKSMIIKEGIPYSQASPQPIKESEKGIHSFITLIISLTIATIIMIILVKYKLSPFIKIWTYIALFISIGVTLSVFFKAVYVYIITTILVLLFNNIKNKIGIVIDNAIQFLVIPGLMLIFSPMLDILYATIFMVILSIYDYISVNITRHMIRFAEVSQKTGFIGLKFNYLPIKTGKSNKRINKKSGKTSTAILGGGDLAFPAIFIGSYMDFLAKIIPYKPLIFLYTSPLIVFSTISLYTLFVKSKKGRYYPAIPYLTVGLLIGLLISLSFLLLKRPLYL